MPSAPFQQTIGKATEVTGRGYWSGQEVTVRFLPAATGTGVRFLRTDIENSSAIPALAGFRESMSLRTVLKNEEGSTVSMVEHLLAALFAHEIDNCLIEVNADEMPGLDGSAAPFAVAIQEAGVQRQSAPAPVVSLDRVIRIGTAASWIEASPSDEGCLEVEYQLDYGKECPIQAQTAKFPATADSFNQELAPARTFVTADQARQLRESGVAAHVTTKDLLIFDHDGLVDNTLHFENECARHKAMDMVGDLALTGARIVGRFVSHRGGHEINALMAKKLRTIYQPIGQSCRMTA